MDSIERPRNDTRVEHEMEMEGGEWGDLDAKLERKKRARLRRQQRELKKQMKEAEAREEERRRLSLRCEEMAREEEISVAMMRYYRQREIQERRAQKLQKDMEMYGETVAVREKAKRLGLDIHTPGLVGEERLAVLRSRVETREDAIRRAAVAHERLNAQPEKRSRMRGLLAVYHAAAARSKVERAVQNLRCEALIPLLDPYIVGKRAEPTLLNMESRNGLTPMLCMIFRRKLADLRRLLELGASPDWETSGGATPLLASVVMDDLVALDILVDSKVTIDRANRDGLKALHLAADKGRTALVKALIRHGADVNGTIAGGRTALMQAVLSKHYDTAQVLIAFGAKKDAVDKDGMSALHFARQYGAHQISVLLTSSINQANLLASQGDKEHEEADLPEAVRRCTQQTDHISAREMEVALKQRDVGRFFRLFSEDEHVSKPTMRDQTTGSPGHQPEDRSENGDGDDESIDENCNRGSDGDGSQNIAAHSSGMARQWSIRSRALRYNMKRTIEFENERLKVWKYAQRGRRNGLIAPLPNDPAGRFKFPLCDNCQAARARKRCFMCDQLQCDKCHARLHEIAHRTHHKYAEVEPVLSVGSQPLDDVRKRQEELMPAAINRSLSIVQSMKRMLVPSEAPASCMNGEDLEIVMYNRKQRIAREKEIAYSQLHVPTAAMKHASKHGDEDIYITPSEIDLTDLYITQGKLSKARNVIERAMRLAEESLGLMHPTMLRVQVRLARIEQHEGDLEPCLKRITDAVSSFESILHTADDDLIVAQDLLLELLDLLARYQDGVEQACHILKSRVDQLGPAHQLCEQSRRRLDTFTAKRELKAMHNEDVLFREQEAVSAQQEQRRQDAKERHLRGFRDLLLEQSPLETYEAFVSYAKKEFADSLVQFWIAAEKAKTTIDESDARAFRAAAVSIYVTFIKSRRIKLITAIQRKRIKKTITTPGKPVPRSIYDEVQAVVFDTIYNRVYARYQQTSNPEDS